MNHHSEGSWSTHITQYLKSEVGEYRKRASIAWRKEKSTQENKTSQRLDNSAQKHAAVPEDAQDGKTDFKALLERDLDIVSRYFAFGGGDTQEEEVVIWARLTDQVI
jgi:predicted Zn-dependent protease